MASFPISCSPPRARTSCPPDRGSARSVRTNRSRPRQDHLAAGTLDAREHALERFAFDADHHGEPVDQPAAARAALEDPRARRLGPGRRQEPEIARAVPRHFDRVPIEYGSKEAGQPFGVARWNLEKRERRGGHESGGERSIRLVSRPVERLAQRLVPPFASARDSSFASPAASHPDEIAEWCARIAARGPRALARFRSSGALRLVRDVEAFRFSSCYRSTEMFSFFRC